MFDYDDLITFLAIILIWVCVAYLLRDWDRSKRDIKRFFKMIIGKK